MMQKTIVVRFLTCDACLYWAFPIYALAAILCSPGQLTWAQNATRIRLTDVTARSGLDFIHTDGGTGRRYIVESVAAGMATLDFDGDGLVDVLFVNGMPLDQDHSKQQGNGSGRANTSVFGRCALYRNNGDWTFTEVSQQAGLTEISYGMGVVAADYDEDGDIDLYLSNFGKNLFYANNGDGTFSEIGESIGLVMPEKVGAGAVFLDIDNDGDLDLYAGSYVDFSIDKHQDHFIGKHQFHPGPTDYAPSADALFRNEGNGVFVDVSHQSGIASLATYSMGVIAFDADGDRDTDILVVNDQRANTLWINDGSGVFEDQALIMGIAFDQAGKANGNMGVDIGDVNRDGLIDVLTTTYQDEMPVLYINLGEGLFMDQTNLFKLDTRLKPHVTWGCGLIDLDNDQDLDIYIGCGHFMDNIQHIDDRTSLKVRDFVLENLGSSFTDVSQFVGSGLQVVESTRAVAFDDFDNDGRIDLIGLNVNAPCVVVRNDSEAASDSGMNLTLVGTKSNRQGVGATVSEAIASGSRVWQVVSGRGYQSHYGSRLHLARSTTETITLQVQWPSGLSEIFQVVPSDKLPVLIEGLGSPAK